MVISDEIKFYHSGSGQADNRSLGGPIDLTAEIADNALHGLFDAVSSAEAAIGIIEYRCIYIKNTNQTDDLTNVQIYLSKVPVHGTIRLILGTAPIDGVEIPVSDEVTKPQQITSDFEDAVDTASALTMPALEADKHKALWIERTIPANTASTPEDTFEITVVGETA